MKNFKRIAIGLAVVVVGLTAFQFTIQTIQKYRNSKVAQLTANQAEAFFINDKDQHASSEALAFAKANSVTVGIQADTSYADTDCVQKKQTCSYVVPQANPGLWQKFKNLVFGRTQLTCNGATADCKSKVLASTMDVQGSFALLNYRWKKILCQQANYNVQSCAGDEQINFASLRLEGVDGDMSTLKLGNRFILATNVVGGVLSNSPDVDVKVTSSNDSWWKKLLNIPTAYADWDKLDKNGVGRYYHGKEFSTGTYTIIGIKQHKASNYQPVSLSFAIQDPNALTNNKAVFDTQLIKTAQAILQAPPRGAPSKFISPRGQDKPNPLLTLPQVSLTGPSSAADGSTITLNWSNSAAKSCTASGAWSGQWNNVAAQSGTFGVVVHSRNPYEDSNLTFSYNCTNLAGSNYSSVEVTIPAIAQPTISTLPPGTISMQPGPLNSYQKYTANLLQAYADEARTHHVTYALKSNDAGLISTAQAQTTASCPSGVTYIPANTTSDGNPNPVSIFIVSSGNNENDTALVNQLQNGSGWDKNTNGSAGGFQNPQKNVQGQIEYSDSLQELLKGCGLMSADGQISQDILNSSMLFCILDVCAHEYTHDAFDDNEEFQGFTKAVWQSLTKEQQQSFYNELVSSGPLYTEAGQLGENGTLADPKGNLLTEFMAYLFSGTGMTFDQVQDFFSGGRELYDDQFMTTYSTANGLITFDKTSDNASSQHIIVTLSDPQTGSLTNLVMLTYSDFAGKQNIDYSPTEDSEENGVIKIPTATLGDGILTISIGQQSSQAYINYGDQTVSLNVEWIKDNDGNDVLKVSGPEGSLDPLLPPGGSMLVTPDTGWVVWQDASGNVLAMMPPKDSIDGLPPGGLILNPTTTTTLDGQEVVTGTLQDGTSVTLHPGSGSDVVMERDPQSGVTNLNIDGIPLDADADGSLNVGSPDDNNPSDFNLGNYDSNSTGPIPDFNGDSGADGGGGFDGAYSGDDWLHNWGDPYGSIDFSESPESQM